MSKRKPSRPEPQQPRLAVESTTVQFPLVDHAVAVDWQPVTDTAALGKRRGEGGLYFYDELEAALLRLNPGVVAPADVPGIVQRLESLPNTIEGNREVLDWLRGKQTLYVDSEKRRRNVRLIDFDNAAGSNVFQVTWEWAYRNGLRKGNRADVVFLINGVPVAIVENKNPKSKDAMSKALVQLRRYELEFYALADSEGVSDIDDLNRILDHAVNLRAFLKSDARVDEVARFVAQHFRENVEPLGYKAFLVGVDREACALYKQALDQHLPAEYSVPVYTKGAADVIDHPLVARYQVDDAEEKRARKLFRKPDREPKILIVTDKLLTGYDAPVLYAMYLDKPMRDHVLLQAIARVNRPYEDEKGRQKPCGLIVDFIGMLRDLNKALAFDSQDVSGVIEDLDLLLVEFRRLLADAEAKYLAPRSGPKDKQLEHLLYDVLLDPGARQEFIDRYRQIEGLYEILSPSAELRDHIDSFRKLVDLYLMVRSAYGSPTRFYEDVARKTELMIREMASSYGPVATGKTVEFDLKTLQALRAKDGDDNATVINLVRAIEHEAEEKPEHPVLVDIAQRAQAILEALEQRTLTTQKAVEQIELLVQERDQADEAREQLGLDPTTFAIYWHLRGDGLKEALLVAQEIMAAASRYPNHADSEDERRQLKAEIYRSLLRETSGGKMVTLGDAVLRLLGRDRLQS